MDRAKRAVEIVALIRSAGHESAIVGGVAVSMRARERFTKDIDYAVAVSTDKESEALGRAMQGLGFSLVTVIEQESKGLIATLRFRDPLSSSLDPGVDLIFAACGIEPEIVEGATPLAISPDASVPVARIPHLIAMKVLSASEVRDQDRVDLQILVQVASRYELAEARAAVALIAERGFHREKDLAADLKTIIESRGSSA